MVLMMPSYDFRCKQCAHVFMLSYKSVRDYEAAQPACPQCDSIDLTRLIHRVSIARPGRDYAGMSSNEMLAVMEGGDSREMGELFRQVGETVPGGMDSQYQQVADRLLGGESPDRVERDLRAQSDAQISAERKANQASGDSPAS